MVEMALVLLVTLLEKLLCLLSGLDSDPSKLGTLRMVLDLAIVCLFCVGLEALMVFIVPVEAGVRVFSGESCTSLFLAASVAPVWVV